MYGGESLFVDREHSSRFAISNAIFWIYHMCLSRITEYDSWWTGNVSLCPSPTFFLRTTHNVVRNIAWRLDLLCLDFTWFDLSWVCPAQSCLSHSCSLVLDSTRRCPTQSFAERKSWYDNSHRYCRQKLSSTHIDTYAMRSSIYKCLHYPNTHRFLLGYCRLDDITRVNMTHYFLSWLKFEPCHFIKPLSWKFPHSFCTMQANFW